MQCYSTKQVMELTGAPSKRTLFNWLKTYQQFLEVAIAADGTRTYTENDVLILKRVASLYQTHRSRAIRQILRDGMDNPEPQVGQNQSEAEISLEVTSSEMVVCQNDNKVQKLEMEVSSLKKQLETENAKNSYLVKVLQDKIKQLDKELEGVNNRLVKLSEVAIERKTLPDGEYYAFSGNDQNGREVAFLVSGENIAIYGFKKATAI